MVPVGVEFLGNDQAEGGLDPLADLRTFGIDGNGVVRSDADERVHDLVCCGLVCAVRCRMGVTSVSQLEAQHQCGRASQFEEATPPRSKRRFGRRYGAQVLDQRRKIIIGPGKIGLGVNHWESPGNSIAGGPAFADLPHLGLSGARLWHQNGPSHNLPRRRCRRRTAPGRKLA